MVYPEENWERKFGFFNPGDLFGIMDREWKLLKYLKKYGYNEKQRVCKVLDVGCGTANNLADFVKFGFLPENLFGIDIRREDLMKSSKLHHHLNLMVADGEGIPFLDETFDIILTFTLFATILGKESRHKVAYEILRVLKKDGVILWFDMRLPNPFNPSVRNVSRREIKRIFGDALYDIKSSTLNPLIARKTAPISFAVTSLLNALPLLHTHLCGIIKKI